MQFVKTENYYLIRLEKGEDIIPCLTKFCEENNVLSGVFQGIGAFLSSELGYYNLENKEYSFKKIDKACEIVSLTGNLSVLDGKPFFHIHTVLSDENLACFGGHLKQGTVGATCEIYLLPSVTKIERELDEAIGLKLLCLNKEPQS